MLKKLIFSFVLYAVFHSGSVYAQCTLTVTNISFGSYDITSPTNLTATGTITVNCLRNEIITLSIGPSSSGGINPRRMKHSYLNDYLNYNLYQDAAMTVIWGDGSQGTTPVSRRVKNRTFTVYGSVFYGQDVSAGLYTDAVAVTVNP